ncbi:sodium:proton antiporter [Quadrisphaera sp. DSM 44207]|uniref:sodium:proton antiporter n=1 Tax=Quadrisphaera sp. DSM 44207 TaxID=1881057 RepID=UPI000889A92F|nr:sodium:proton antiporter [Quadrisphaera sp. DSM 44207]SDQ41511.1 multisubunit sodium/proton antiporter, MrpC subunit [Quadrisphaera sp. DSM 44207]
MNLAFALVAAVLFGGGAYLLLQRDLLRVVAGVTLVSQSATVTLIGSSLVRGQAPIDPVAGQPVADPLPQALALTALVIGLATVSLLLALLHKVAAVTRSAAQSELAATEERHEAGLAGQRARDESEVG